MLFHTFFIILFASVFTNATVQKKKIRGFMDLEFQRNFDKVVKSMNSTQEQVTYLLDSLLKGYDKDRHPGMEEGKRTEVQVNLNIRSMGPISELHMDYLLDCYFRQIWLDPRLQFNHLNISSQLNRGLALSLKMLDNIWKPDTYILNGRGSYIHTLTTPNKLIRIDPSGMVLYSMRITIKASCPMVLKTFPMDEQVCPLVFGSYAYTGHDILYRWHEKVGVESGAVVLSKDVTLSQFTIATHPFTRNFSLTRQHGQEFSILSAHFHLVRHMGFFLIQVYIPCILLVVLSWVSFWINREATADRVSLGITTVLTLTTLSMDSRQDLPRVGYPTALDYYIFTCFFFVIASIVEFACVHHFTKFGSGENRYDLELSDRESYESDVSENGDPAFKLSKAKLRLVGKGKYVYEQNYNKIPLKNANNIKHSTVVNTKCNRYDWSSRRKGCERWPVIGPLIYCFSQVLECLKGSEKQRLERQKLSAHKGINSVSQIDQVSKVVFPSTFVLLNILYWVAYLRPKDIPNHHDFMFVS